jgi:hypothetical protein
MKINSSNWDSPEFINPMMHRYRQMVSERVINLYNMLGVGIVIDNINIYSMPEVQSILKQLTPEVIETVSTLPKKDQYAIIKIVSELNMLCKLGFDIEPFPQMNEL